MRTIAMLLLTASCSVFLQSKPKEGRGQCSESAMLAVVDTVLLVGAASEVVVGTAIGGESGRLIAGPNGVVGILFLASADNGFKWATACRRLNEAPAGAVSTR